MVSSREGENCYVGVAFFSVKKDVMHEMLFDMKVLLHSAVCGQINCY